jgi:hypothetical protein
MAGVLRRKSDRPDWHSVRRRTCRTKTRPNFPSVNMTFFAKTPRLSKSLEAKSVPDYQFDEQRDCFVISSQQAPGKRVDTHLALCFICKPFFVVEDAFLQRLDHVLHSMTTNHILHGAFLRVGVCANPDVSDSVTQHLQMADQLSQSAPSTRNAVLRELALSNAQHLADSASVSTRNLAVNYEYFISVFVPLDSTKDSHDTAARALDEARSLIDARLFACAKVQLPCNSQRYEHFLSSLLIASNLSLETDSIACQASAHCNALSRSFGFDVRNSIKNFTSTEHSLLGAKYWADQAGITERPTHFLMTSTYTIISPHTNASCIEKGSAALKAVSLLPVGRLPSRARHEMNERRRLLQLVEEGARLVRVSVSATAYGIDDESLNRQSDQLLSHMARLGLRSIPAESSETMPLTAPSTDRTVRTVLLPVTNAVRLAPILAGTPPLTQPGLQLQSEAGQPTFFDFTANNDLTVITGVAGAGKSYLLWGITAHSLSCPRPVFAVSDYTFFDVEASMGGVLLDNDRSATNHFSPISIAASTVGSDEAVSRALEYIVAVASLSEQIRDYDVMILSEWLTEKSRQHIEQFGTDYQSTIPDLLEQLIQDELAVPTILTALQPFAKNGIYASYLPKVWSTDLANTEFTVTQTPSGYANGAHVPKPVTIAQYLTYIALARNLFQRPDVRTPALVVLEAADDILMSTTQVKDYLLNTARLCRKYNCAMIVTVCRWQAIMSEAGQFLASYAHHFISLQPHPALPANQHFRKLFCMNEEGERTLGMLKTFRHHCSEMAIRSAGHTGVYRSSASPFAHALFNRDCEFLVQFKKDHEKSTYEFDFAGRLPSSDGNSSRE